MRSTLVDARRTRRSPTSSASNQSCVRHNTWWRAEPGAAIDADRQVAAYLPGLVPTAPGHLGDVLLTLVVRRVGGPRPLGLCHQVPGEVSKLGVLRLRRAYHSLERFVGIDALSRHDDANCLADHRTVNECSAQASYLSVCCCQLRHGRLSICGSLVALCRVPQALVRAAYQFLLPS